MHESVIVGEAVAGESAKVRNQLEEIVRNINTQTFDLADLLNKVKKNSWYTGWGYNTFQEYIETIDIKLSKAHYLTRIVGVMEQVNIPRETYENVGIAKLREIASLEPGEIYVNPQNNIGTPTNEIITDLVNRADDFTINELKQAVKVFKGLVGEDELVWVNYSVKSLVKEQILNPALELARKQIGTLKKDDDGVAVDAGDGACWEIIAVEFLNDPANFFLAEKHQEVETYVDDPDITENETIDI